MTTANDNRSLVEETGFDRRRGILADNALSVELMSAFAGDRQLTEAEKDYLAISRGSVPSDSFPIFFIRLPISIFLQKCRSAVD